MRVRSASHLFLKEIMSKITIGPILSINSSTEEHNGIRKKLFLSEAFSVYLAHPATPNAGIKGAFIRTSKRQARTPTATPLVLAILPSPLFTIANNNIVTLFHRVHLQHDKEEKGQVK